LLSFCRSSFLIEKCWADPSPNCYRLKKLKDNLKFNKMLHTKYNISSGQPI
jgi:hypothetical protein